MQMSPSLSHIPQMEHNNFDHSYHYSLHLSSSAASILRDGTTRNSFALHNLDKLWINIVAQKLSALFSWVFLVMTFLCS